jgi:excisionase family DNA binding protein
MIPLGMIGNLHGSIGIKNARLNSYILMKGITLAKILEKTLGDHVLTTKESCFYLRITKPTFFKYIREGRIKATKAGKGWKVLKSELDRFLRGDQ